MSYHGFDHVQFYVSNAKQAADWYVIRFGFQPLAYRGLETGSRDMSTHVISHGKVIFAFSSPYNPIESDVSRRIMIQGDAAKDVAFTVDDATALWKKAVDRGAKSLAEPHELKDEFGSVILATVQTYGDTTHTFVERKNYKGPFLPGYKLRQHVDPATKHLPPTEFEIVDHVVGNQPDLKMVEAVEWYERCLDFHRFWTVDDKMIHTEFSSLRSIVVADKDEVVKMPINEPAAGKKKSQIQEYVEYHGGAGVQHIALKTPNVLKTVTAMRDRGVDFLRVPKQYYQDLRKRLEHAPIKVTEDLNKIEELGILVDFDDQGYLLQIFTKPVQDRPTLFYEVIQRHNHQGFGAGNFKSLFESIEREQAERGNL